MKFIDEFDIELVNQALQFETADCRIQGGCDLFSTRPAGSDKKLYKIIDNHINILLKESAELNDHPPKENPYYPRSFSSNYTSIKKIANTNEVVPNDTELNSIKRRNSDITSSTSKQTSIEPPEIKETTVTKKPLTPSNNSNQESEFKKPRSRSSSILRKSFSEAPLARDIDIIRRRSSSFNNNDNEDPFTPPNKVYDIINQSPFGPLDRSGSRKVFVYLIAVLNSTYPDHDFSMLEPSDFIKITPIELIEKFNNTMISLGKLPMEWIWDTLSNHIDLYKCNVYYFVPSESFLEDMSGSLWSQMWFIFNKKRKRVAYLYLNAIKKNIPFRNNYYIGSGSKRRQSITIDNEYESFDDDEDDEEADEEELNYEEEALMSDIDEEE